MTSNRFHTKRCIRYDKRSISGASSEFDESSSHFREIDHGIVRFRVPTNVPRFQESSCKQAKFWVAARICWFRDLRRRRIWRQLQTVLLKVFTARVLAFITQENALNNIELRSRSDLSFFPDFRVGFREVDCGW